MPILILEWGGGGGGGGGKEVEVVPLNALRR